MKALSIMQPWAWLIVNGFKSVENRTWEGRHRGPLLIHAGKKVDAEAYDFIRSILPNVDIPGPKTIERGGIVGQAVMTGCITRSDNVWFFGPFGFTLEDARPLPFRPMKGQLGFFDIGE